MVQDAERNGHIVGKIHNGWELDVVISNRNSVSQRELSEEILEMVSLDTIRKVHESPESWITSIYLEKKLAIRVESCGPLLCGY